MPFVALAVGKISLTLLLRGITLSLKCSKRVLLYLIIQLLLQSFVVTEVSHGRHRNEVDLTQSVADKLLLVVISALQAVIVVRAILNEASGEHTREESDEEEE